MEMEYPFRSRGRHGFDREDVINYITQAQQRCNEHLARMEELEAAKNAWYTQVKSMEREKSSLVARNRELEEQLERSAAAGGDWYAQADPLLSNYPEAQELAAVRARCVELEQRLERQDAADIQALNEAREAADVLRQEADALRAQAEALQSENAGLAQQLQEKEEAPPRFTMHQQEVDALRAQLEQQVNAEQAHASRIAALEQENAAASQQLEQLEQLQQENDALRQKVAALESDNAGYAEQLPALQEQLACLARSAEQIQSLEEMKAALAAELDAAKQQGDDAQNKAAQQAQSVAALQQEKETLAQRCAALAQAEAQARQKNEALASELEAMQTQVKELEEQSGSPSEETLRSMVLASFNYSNLYVDNNLKTAQFISEATSRNIGRVSDSANSLLDQLESIARSFNETTDGIRRNLAAFQHELGTIQNGMNRRLSKDRFAALLEENEKLRTQLESELLAELSDEEDPIPPLHTGEQAKLPFAEDLPQNYHEYLDD